MTSETRVVLVTGGAGFVGSAVVRRLAARGHAVHVFARASANRAALADLELVWHAGELEDERSLRTALESSAAAARGGRLDLVHLAARISYRRADRALLRSVNVDGTGRVLELARIHGVRRMCHVSSVVALGPVATKEQELDDDAPLGGRTLFSAYASTKAESEELVQAASSALDVVIASPGVVFGVSPSGSNSLHFLARLLRGTLGPLSPPGSISVVGLEDCAEGIVLALERGVRGRRYLLSESTWSLHDLFILASRQAGRRGPFAPVAPLLWRAIVAVLAGADRIVPSERATPEALALLGLHFRFRARRARAELGWLPRPFPEVLREIVLWLRAVEPHS